MSSQEKNKRVQDRKCTVRSGKTNKPGNGSLRKGEGRETVITDELKAEIERLQPDENSLDRG
jgi:hypothetical protein